MEEISCVATISMNIITKEHCYLLFQWALLQKNIASTLYGTVCCIYNVS